MTKRRCRKGDLLFRKNDLANEMFLVVKGTYRVCELNKLINPGEIFGELGLLTSEQRQNAIYRMHRKRTRARDCLRQSPRALL